MKKILNLSQSFLLALMLVFGSFMAQAQDEEDDAPQLSISGSIDTYYRLGLNVANDPEAGGNYQAPTSSFANLPGFSLGMANIILGMDGEKSGFVADLVFGPRGSDAVFASPMYSSTGQIVNQLYGYWNVSDAVTLTIANYKSFLGSEVISPTANFNYSTSYMFSYGPFSHTGVKADFTFGDFTMMTALMNSTDLTEFSPDGQYYAGLQFGYGGAYLNFLFDDDFFQADLTAGWDLTESLYLGVNGTYATDNFFGAALYLQTAVSDDFSLGLRGEYFSDEGVGALPFLAGGGPAGADLLPGSAIDFTLSANYSVGNLTFIPEFRVDIFDEDVIVPEAGEAAQGALASFLVAAVYSF
ncbi:MAG: outer membrane beta-barrel protein [Cyclobacteriaceae bacterium]